MAEGVALTVALCDCMGEADALCVPLPLPLPVADGEGVVLGVADAVAEGVGVPLPLALGVGGMLLLLVTDGVGETLGEAEGEAASALAATIVTTPRLMFLVPEFSELELYRRAQRVAWLSALAGRAAVSVTQAPPEGALPALTLPAEEKAAAALPAPTHRIAPMATELRL